MKIKIKILCTAVILALGTYSYLPAGIPKLINHQGILTDSLGNHVKDSTYSVTFTIYTAATGEDSLWRETQPVATRSGLFNVILGQVNPVPDTTFNDTARWLGIQLQGDPEMTPRIRFTSVPYTFSAATANQIQTTGTVFRNVTLAVLSTVVTAFTVPTGKTIHITGIYAPNKGVNVEVNGSLVLGMDLGLPWSSGGGAPIVLNSGDVVTLYSWQYSQ